MSDRILALSDLRIDGHRLWRSLMDLAKIGATEKGGVCRLALTQLDKEARDLIVRWATELGCAVRIDKIGNIVARRPGTNPDLPSVMTGSHIDTQPTGGKFDGNYGVLAGLEVLRTLNDQGLRTIAPVEVVVWTNEEGSRFVPVMMGSGVASGAFSLEYALSREDADQISVEDALKSIGYQGCVEPSYSPKAYFEAHIEQGPALETAACTVGVVTGALGQRWYNVKVQGQEAHAGPTPMNLRRDALLAAADLVKGINRIATESSPNARGTVGCMSVFPNSRNVIPGQVTMTVDLRADSAELLDILDAQFRRLCSECELPVEVEQVVHFAPQPFDSFLVGSVRRTSADLGYSSMDLLSGAGHDAVYLASIAPAAMIFVPCEGGISHNEVENASPKDLEAGANVLLQIIIEAAGVDDA
ncbi:Zn-dependent hydrolase [Paraburkholderia sp. BL10I2N1]|uniref:Zn-dependent hydrolase n=1 Tax=Paraburkholderia sp. BL10I2N1 TaxID=1938796 RepID=UPI0010F0BCEA|nr:Zn-dependent hydrolase [Paraburkholderia sp. BL10I2N1]TDN63097.1 N-carbamoyl-L-amino-acid hydrolase [Paraburkholderia sp. BL10I2N1]